MRKHWKLTAIAIAVVLALTIGLATAVFAQEETPTAGEANNGPVRTFITKVANILGLEEQQVTDAFNQARQEMANESVEQRLQKAVENGRLTQEQADEILEWWQSRPEALQKFGPGMLAPMGRVWCHQQAGYRGLGAWVLPPERALAQIFDERIEGTITAVSADDGTISLTTEDGSLVTVAYTSNTRYLLQGSTALGEGQTVVAWCWEDAEGNLTASVVRVTLP